MFYLLCNVLTRSTHSSEGLFIPHSNTFTQVLLDRHQSFMYHGFLLHLKAETNKEVQLVVQDGVVTFLATGNNGVAISLTSLADLVHQKLKDRLQEHRLKVKLPE